MKMRDKIAAVKAVQGYETEIKQKLKEIIEQTSDFQCRCVTDFMVGDTHIEATYESVCRGEYYYEDMNIPIEWLDEGFNYKAAYEKQKRKKRN